MKPKVSPILLLLLVFALAITACEQAPEIQEQLPLEEGQAEAIATQAVGAAEELVQAQCPTPEPCPECPTCPTPAPTPVVDVVPFEEAWASSPHAMADAEAFTHWDEEGEIPPDCARCHSTPGYLDYLGADDSTFREVDAAAPIGTVITCEACHNPVAANLTSVIFPSGAEIAVEDTSARCMVCHQGRASLLDVDAAIEEAGLIEEPDTASDALGFVNIHYYFAAATLFGSEAQGGYQFEGRDYQPEFEHVDEFDRCAECHSPHSLEVRVDACTECHQDVESVEGLREIRMQGSLADYDGDGDIEEGIYFEIETLQEMLQQAIAAYAADVTGAPIIYADSYPYFFADTNGNGEADDDEVVFDNQYTQWTPRLLRAAYNYHASLEDPGAFAHNPKYIIQLLYDSIDVLNEQLAEPVPLADATRFDPGHFQATAEAFRHWDEDGVVPPTCTKCHTSEGLPYFLEFNSTRAFEPSNSLSCATCHSSVPGFELYEVGPVEFPSGATLAFEDNTESNICLQCHQGREATTTVNAAILEADVGPDQVSEALNFVNPHYFAAAATLFGTQASGAYEYDGQAYDGQFEHVPGFDSCGECHNVHALEVRAEECTDCHQIDEEIGLESIRLPDGDTPIDFDGDGNVDEGIAFEIATIHEQLLLAIIDYAANTIGTPIVYDPANYPYWFIDTNANEVADEDEINFGNQYNQWTPTLLRAAYNYQYVSKDPGAFAHNSDYILQILYDSLAAIGGQDAVAGMVRPEAIAPEPVEETP